MLPHQIHTSCMMDPIYDPLREYSYQDWGPLCNQQTLLSARSSMDAAACQLAGRPVIKKRFAVCIISTNRLTPRVPYRSKARGCAELLATRTLGKDCWLQGSDRIYFQSSMNSSVSIMRVLWIFRALGPPPEPPDVLVLQILSWMFMWAIFSLGKLLCAENRQSAVGRIIDWIQYIVRYTSPFL